LNHKQLLKIFLILESKIALTSPENSSKPEEVGETK
jgi:hypothetical protein